MMVLPLERFLCLLFINMMTFSKKYFLHIYGQPATKSLKIGKSAVVYFRKTIIVHIHSLCFVILAIMTKIQNFLAIELYLVNGNQWHIVWCNSKQTRIIYFFSSAAILKLLRNRGAHSYFL